MSSLQNTNHYFNIADFVFMEMKAANVVYKFMPPEKEVIV
jgi:hypothetical protein